MECIHIYKVRYPKDFSQEDYKFVFILDAKYGVKEAPKRLDALAKQFRALDCIGSLFYETKTSQLGSLLIMSQEALKSLKAAHEDDKAMKFLISEGEVQEERVNRFWIEHKKQLNALHFIFILNE